MAKWIWPCPGNNTITSGVGERWGTQHKGIDISAPRGDSIVASRDGVVTKIYTTCTHNYGKEGSCGCSTYGNHVYIDHKDGYETRYAHMTNVFVKVGQRVGQGSTIGTVGSTGYSTGNHLHFEVRYKDTVQDPEKLVDPGNTIVDPGVTKSTTTTEDSKAAARTVSNEGDSIEVTPVITRDFLEGKGYHAYVKIYVGERVLNYEEGKPSILQSFEINRLEDAGSSANFVLFDDDWDSLEPLLADNYDNISVEYGYAGTNIISARYRLLLQDYTIDFLQTGTILSIHAVSLGIYQNLDRKSFHTETKNPTNAIEKICHYMGWEIDLDNWIETNTVDREEDYKLLNDNPITYIFKTILPEAITALGETIVFSVENNIASLRVKSYGTDNNKDESNIPTYVYQRGYDSVVESLSFNTKGVFGGTTRFETVTKLNGESFDMNTKEEIKESEDLDSTLTVATGNYSSTRTEQSSANLIAAGHTASQMNARLTYHIKNASDQNYELNMTILGDPRIEILQQVRLINITDYGSLHHTSGIYLVKGITDTVEDGNFKTSLQLIRNADISTGIVLKSPKSLKK